MKIRIFVLMVLMSTPLMYGMEGGGTPEQILRMAGGAQASPVEQSAHFARYLLTNKEKLEETLQLLQQAEQFTHNQKLVELCRAVPCAVDNKEFLERIAQSTFMEYLGKAGLILFPLDTPPSIAPSASPQNAAASHFKEFASSMLQMTKTAAYGYILYSVALPWAHKKLTATYQSWKDGRKKAKENKKVKLREATIS